MRRVVQRELYIPKTREESAYTTLCKGLYNEVVLKEGGDPVELMTIKQYAESQNVSYEAVRKQIVGYGEELKDHIVRKGRTQYLDEWAVEFLTKRRRENPIILLSQDKDEAIESMKQQIETLRVQLMTAQNELLKSQDERLKAQDRIIELQDEAKKTLEDRAKYTALLEDNEAKAKRLKEAEDREAELTRQVEERDGQIRTIQTEAEDLRKKAEADRETIEDLQRERDEAQKEAQSFTRSIFGFYRKK